MAAYDAWGNSWGPAGAGAWGVSWYHSDAVVDTDTHDGFDEKRKRRDSEFKGARERLRETLRMAWDGPGEVAAEVQALARPYVDILESGALRIDHEALERRRAAVMAEILAFEDALRAEYRARIAAYEQDEDDVAILALWS